MDYREAYEIAGRLFGNILSRDSDKAGFDHAVYLLLNGVAPLTICSEMIQSDEFIRRFLINQTACNISSGLTSALCGWDQSPDDIINSAVHIHHSGYKNYVQQTVDKAMNFREHKFVPNLIGKFD